MKSEKFLRILAVVLMIFTAIGALPVGYSFIADPSGAGMGATVAVLQYSPFSDFLIPGLTLFICNGLLNLLAAGLSIGKIKYYPYLIFAQGSILFGWIGFQVAFLRLFNWYHLVFGIIGLVLIVIGWLLLRRSPKGSPQS